MTRSVVRANIPLRWRLHWGFRGAILLATLLATLGAASRVQADPGDDLTVYALTFGPGEHPFLKFGHNAILVQPQSGPGWVFNFGTFDFSDPDLLPKFLRGRFKYWLSVGGAEATVEAYSAENRTILSQELDLSAAQISSHAICMTLRTMRPDDSNIRSGSDSRSVVRSGRTDSGFSLGNAPASTATCGASSV